MRQYNYLRYDYRIDYGAWTSSAPMGAPLLGAQSKRIRLLADHTSPHG